jgi:SSS family solute:Na+ symporter
VDPRPPNALAFVIIATYLAASIAVGYLVRRHADTSSKFLHARGLLPTAVTALAFLAANCGALEIVGITATSAKYGVLALHFYWIGAIPAMVFLALFMMPVYSRSGAMTVPDFIRIRYNNATHIVSALCLAVMMVLVAGISLYAISAVLQTLFGWDFSLIAVVAASVVLCYALVGGLRATIYNEIFQLGLTVAGLLPLACAVYRDFHGVRGILARLPATPTHLWTTLPLMQPRTAVMDVVGVVFGLGFVLSFGYWCTDFVLIQRALTAKTAEGAVKTPLIAAVFKLVFPWLVIFPGMSAVIFLKPGKLPQFDQALPLLISRYSGYGLMGLGISAILASLMSGLAGNITAFSTLWTHDLYQAHLKPNKPDAHYLRVGRAFTVLAACLSIATAYIVLFYNNLMDYLQLIFSTLNAPIFAVFLLGMFTTWAMPTAGCCGLLFGLLAAVAHNIAIQYGAIHYGSQMLGNFYGAIYAWIAATGATAIVSCFTAAKPKEALQGLTWSTQGDGPRQQISLTTWTLALAVILACVALNIIFR